MFHFLLVSRRVHDPCVALLLKLESILIALSRKTCLRSCFYLLTKKHFVFICHMLGDERGEAIDLNISGMCCLFPAVCDGHKGQSAIAFGSELWLLTVTVLLNIQELLDP